MRRVFGWLAVVCFALFALGVVYVAADDPVKPAPLTEVESLRAQNLSLERVIIERQVSDWQVKQEKLKADIEAARAGWTWNPIDGQFTPKTEVVPK